LTLKKSAVVIGSGIGGLAAAVRLALQGFSVQVFEANGYAGGKLSQIEAHGYRFDAGPSLFTMPENVTDLFKLAGKNAEDYFQYSCLDELCRYWYPDGTQFTAWGDNQKFAYEASRATGENEQSILNFLKSCEHKYQVAGELFMHRSMSDWRTWLNKSALMAYPQILGLGLFSSMASANSKQLKIPHMQQYFNRYATYNGSDPWQVPALLSVIPHIEHGRGAFLPKGGMISITNAVYRLALDLGVEFHFNQKVHEIIANGIKASGISVGKEVIAADVVVCNMDFVNAYKGLLRKQQQPGKLLAQPKSSSALIFYWGMKAQFPELGLHNILFSADYKKEFETIFKQNAVSDDPTVYINITSKHEPSDAPAGCENWFTMINVPNNAGQDWDAIVLQSRGNIMRKLSDMLGKDLESTLDTEMVLEPRGIELKTSSAAGALYGISSNNRFAAFLRHPNRSPYLKNVFFVGGSVHPGGGVPLALLSAKIACHEVAKGY